MADTKISAFTAATGISGADYFPIIQEGENKRSTFTVAETFLDTKYSTTGHNHTGVYSPTGHDHAGVYSPTGHDHAGVYQPAGDYLTSESDPIFTNSAAYSITTGDIASWNSAASGTGEENVQADWNQNDSGADDYIKNKPDLSSYITGFTETDPIFAAASGNFAATDHLHTGVYSPTGHDHAGVYSPTGHDHAGTYVEDVTITADTQFPIDYLYKKVSGVDTLVTEIPKTDGIVDGGMVAWDTGLTFLISACAYYIDGTLYTTDSASVTLPAADPSNPRIDIIVVNTSEEVTYVTGTAAASPSKPQADPGTQIELTQVQINAGETTPYLTLTEELIYDDHTTGEWTATGVGCTFDFDSATNPMHGSICAEITNIGNNDTIVFTGDSTFDTTDYETLLIYIKLKAVMTSQHNLYASFWNDGSQTSSEKSLPIDKANISTWQNISLKLSSFSFFNSSFDQIKLRWAKSGAAADHTGFYLDYIKVHIGVTQPINVDMDNYVDSISWNSTTRILTLGRTGILSDLTVNIPAEASTGVSEAKAIAYSIALG